MKELLKLLELIKSEDIPYEELWICEYQKILQNGTPLSRINPETFELLFPRAFCLAIIHDEKIWSGQFENGSYSNRCTNVTDPRLDPSISDKTITYLNVLYGS